MRLVLAATAVLAGCAGGGSSPPDATALDAPRPYLPIPPMPAMPVPADNPSTDAKVELGRQLFHDPVFSTDRSVACVTCHGEIWGLSDALQFSIGVGGVGAPGLGRYGPTHTTRNAMTLWNTGYRASLFWDGHAGSLEAQAPFPMRNPIELGRDPTDVAQELHGYPAYATLFAAAFPGEADPITADNLARALAAFERTLVSDDAPFDRWVRGDRGAIGDDELRGWVVFNEARCVDCHAPPLFESERYETSPAPAVPGVQDDGRFAVTGREEDRGRFRVPTLRNLRTTQPYFHNGTMEDLHDAIALEAGARAPRPLTAGELGDLYAFLYKSLVDMTRLPARPHVAPSGLPVPTDTLEIPRWYDGGTEQ